MTPEQMERVSRWCLYVQCGCVVLSAAFALWLILLH